MAELKTCPFCGGKAQIMHDMNDWSVNGIYCRSCKALVRWNIRWKDKETAGENEANWAGKWNRRAAGGV